MFLKALLLFSCVLLATTKELAKIVDGEETSIEKFPFQIALLYNRRFTCGGSIISAKWVLTAAHCTYRRLESNFTVRAGSSKATSGGQLIPVASVHSHPKFNWDTIDYDICLLELSKELEFGPTVQPIEIALAEPTTRSLAMVAGWGVLKENSRYLPPIIRSVKIPIVRRFSCNLRYFYQVTQRMICAGYIFGGRNICEGDSGGALVYEGKQVGIVSWAAGCARPLTPGVFTNAVVFRDFVRRITHMKV